MTGVTIEPITANNVHHLARLVIALATYEQLEPPPPEAIMRLCFDVSGTTPRIHGVIAYFEETPVGYALFFNTYSSFLAKPTMYLEDLFVDPEARNSGIGSALFAYVRRLAEQQGCGRMEWQVLDWNSLARNFYERRGARAMTEWIPYRIDLTATQDLDEGRR